MTASSDKPTVAVLHYNGGRWRDALVPVMSPGVKVIELSMPHIGRGYLSPSQKAEQLQHFRDWAAPLPHAVARVIKAYMEPTQDPQELRAIRALNTQLHGRNPAPNPQAPFVVQLEDSGLRYLPGSADVQIVHIDVADLRGTSRVGHAEALRRAEALPESVKAQIRERFRSARSVLAPTTGPDRGLGE